MKKYLLLGIMAIALPALAGSSSYADNNKVARSGCFIPINDAKVTRLVNVDYIRLFYIKNETPTIVNISMASNYSVSDSIKHYAIEYTTPQQALTALESFNTSLRSCR